jgi:hypothetical protein
MSEICILIRLLRKYFPQKRKFSLVLSKLRDFGGSLNTPNPAPWYDTAVHVMNTRQHNKLHMSSINLPSIQRSVYSPSIKIFNHLPQNIFKFHNHLHVFKILLGHYLAKNAFDSTEDFFFVQIIIVS